MKKTIFTVIFLTCTLLGISQAFMNGSFCNLNSGSITELDNVTKVNIIYDYSEAGVGGYINEADYLKKRSTELNEKTPGRGDKMITAWHDAKKQRYEPKFEELFNKYGKKINMTGENYSSANNYTLLVKTKFFEPGVNVGVYKRPAFIDALCIFKDKNGKELAVFYLKNIPGAQAMGFDYDVSSRLVESYAKSAKMLINAIVKERKKAKKK